MHCTRHISDDILWVGGSDKRLNLFENLFPVPRGIAYNSYLILDEKTALMDTVDASISRQFIDNILYGLQGRTLDYLIIDHMEPDHCANIVELLHYFPDLKLVGNAKTFQFLKQFYHVNMTENMITVKEKDTLCLGKHTLHFFFAPMVHWPEVMMCYEEKEGILFTADAFGSFGSLDGNLFNDEIDFEGEWLDDYRRYYTNIVGKYGVQVQMTLKKLAGLDLHMIAPLHGPVWRNNLDQILGKYDLWSRYVPEQKSLIIIYGSMYGNTENAAFILANALSEAGIRNIKLYDASSTHYSTLISESFRCSHIVLAAPTYNGEIYDPVHHYLKDCKSLNLANRTFALIDNGTWGAVAGRQMNEMISQLKNCTVLEPAVSLQSALNDQSMEKLMELKEALVRSLNEE